jgi:O-antigen/teichoic acid export membrane protein
MLARNILNTLLTVVFKSALILGQSILLARILGPNARGIFGILNYSVEFFTILFCLNLSRTAGYFGTRFQKNDADLVSFLVKQIFISSLLSFAFLLIGYIFFNGRFFIFPYGVFAETFFVYIALTIVLRLIYMPFAEYYKAKGKVQWVNNIFLLHSVFLCLSYAFYHLCYKLQNSISYLFVIGITSFLAIGLALVFLYQLFYRDGFSFNLKSNNSPYLKYASTGYFEKIFNYLHDRSDYFMLLYFATSPYYIGIYLLVLGIFNTFQKIIIEIGSIFFIHLNKERKAEFSVQFYSKFLIITLFFVTLMLYFFAKKIVLSLYGIDFIESYPVLVLMLPAIFFFGLKELFSLYFASIDKQNINLTISLILFICSIILYAFFIPQRGVYGAAIAYSITQGLTVIIYLIIFNKYANISILNFLYFNKEEQMIIRKFGQKIYKKIKGE